MARAFQRVAAEKHHPHRLCRLYRDAVAGPEYQQSRSLIAIARYLDFAIDYIDGALFMVGVERNADASARGHLGVEPGRHHRDRRRHAERTACYDARGKAAIRYDRQIGG